MRLIPTALACVAFALTSLTTFAAGETSVRGIGFAAANEGATDPRLAPYAATLRSNLSFEHFRYLGESSATVSANGKASLSVPGGGRVELQADANGSVRAQRGGTAVTLSRGRPAVFLSGPPKPGVTGIIVIAE